jgi:hypothetical protein
MSTVAEMIITALAEQGVRTVWGVVGDALNPVTDAIRREERIEWIGVRHEEVAAFAAGAQAQTSGTLGVCMGTVGPGSVHLLNGLYDAKKSHVPVLAVCGQVPLAEMGTDFFQEIDNDALFRDVALFNRTITAPEQAPVLLEQAMQSALNGPGVAVLTLPGDVGGLDLPKGAAPPRVVVAHPPTVPDPAALDRAAAAGPPPRRSHRAVRTGAVRTGERLPSTSSLTSRGRSTATRGRSTATWGALLEIMGSSAFRAPITRITRNHAMDPRPIPAPSALQRPAHGQGGTRRLVRES